MNDNDINEEIFINEKDTNTAEINDVIKIGKKYFEERIPWFDEYLKKHKKEVFEGRLKRKEGEIPGAYSILQGDLKANKNYKELFNI